MKNNHGIINIRINLQGLRIEVTPLKMLTNDLTKKLKVDNMSTFLCTIIFHLYIENQLRGSNRN